MEPEACVSYLEEGDEGEEPILVVIGRSINIHYHLGMLQGALGYENMRYEEAFSGGQFGIKIDITSEGLAAAAAPWTGWCAATSVSAKPKWRSARRFAREWTVNKLLF